jgi:hypothetical protein
VNCAPSNSALSYLPDAKELAFKNQRGATLFTHGAMAPDLRICHPDLLSRERVVQTISDIRLEVGPLPIKQPH